jgi:hypothetical protein
LEVTRVLERCSRSFRVFLKALEGDSCAFCTVAIALEHEQIAQIEPILATRDPVALCGRHFLLALNTVGESGNRARFAQQVIAADLKEGRVLSNRPCRVCTSIEAALKSIAASICRLDGRIRFEKALERASLFCRLHASDVVAGNRAPTFLRVQHDKLKQLDDALAQALLRNRENLEQLIQSVMAYTDGAQSRRIDSEAEKLPTPAVDAEAEGAEFDRWDNQHVLEHLSNLESEVASLSYRNATLAEENRRLKLARAAIDATMRDVEREREALRREVVANRREPNPKASER